MKIQARFRRAAPVAVYGRIGGRVAIDAVVDDDCLPCLHAAHI